MKILGYNIRFTRDEAPESQRSMAMTLGSGWGDPLDGFSGPLSTPYQQVVWVYRAVNVLAEQVANIPFRFSRETADAERLVTSGPLVDLYARPHPHINSFQYWELRVIWLMLRGECFRVPIYDEAGPGRGRNRVPRAILILNPDHFQHIIEGNRLAGWRYTGPGPRGAMPSQVFLPEEVWFERLPNPFDFWRGMSPLQVAALAAKTDFAAASFMKGLMENNADAGLIVRSPQPLDPDQQEQVLAALRDRKCRGGADRPVMLCGGMEVVRPTLSSSDLQFLENRNFSRSEICAAFGVPEEIVTTTDTAKYDVMAGARLNFIENRVIPLCRRLEAEELASIRAVDPEAVGWFDVESLPIMQRARRERLAAARKGFEMGIPFNDLNRLLDLGFRSLPWGDKGYVASGLREVKDA
jgi:HK97 family phage portal protein